MVVEDDFADFGDEEGLVEAFGVAIEDEGWEFEGFGALDGGSDTVGGLFVEEDAGFALDYCF